MGVNLEVRRAAQPLHDHLQTRGQALALPGVQLPLMKWMVGVMLLDPLPFPGSCEMKKQLHIPKTIRASINLLHQRLSFPSSLERPSPGTWVAR